MTGQWFLQNSRMNPSMKALLATAIVAALIPSAIVFHGVELDGDDVLYARLASALADGQPMFIDNSNHSYRLGFIVPLALFYRLFGLQDWTTVAYTVLTAGGTVLVVAYAALRLYGGWVAVWAVLLCGLHPVLYSAGSGGMPDLPAGFLYGVFVVGWVLAATGRGDNRGLWAGLSGIASAWAVVTKESTAPMILLTLAGFLFLGRRHATQGRLLLGIWLLGNCIIGIPYFLYLWKATGDPLFVLHATQRGYNIPGAPWLRPLEGMHFVARLTGLSILRACMEGYVLAVLPVLIAFALSKTVMSDAEADQASPYFMVATIVPMAILSHFSTSVSQWSPVHLDMRFGSPLIIPGSILAAVACVHIRNAGLQTLARVGVWATLLFAFGLLGLGLLQGNLWLVKGAVAALGGGVAVLAARNRPQWFLPTVLVLLLTGNLAVYRVVKYAPLMAHNDAIRDAANAVPRDPAWPILTDHEMARAVQYVHRFDAQSVVEIWAMPGLTGHPFYWAAERAEPWSKPYLLVWRPTAAQALAAAWGTEVPRWVVGEVTRGTLVKGFSNEPGAGVYRVGAR